MLRVHLALVAVSCALLACPAAPPPGDPNDPGNHNGNNGNQTCTLDDGTTLAKPANTDVPKEGASGNDVDRSCVGTPGVITAPAGATATVEGCIKIFGIGNLAKAGIHVAFFGDDQDAHKDQPRFGDVVIATQADAAGLDCSGADAGSAACLSLGCDSQGAYVADNVPLHVPLTVKVSLPGDQTVVDSYSFQEVFDGPNEDEPAVDGVVNYPANLIYANTYSSIPILAGRTVDGGQVLNDGQGRGVIAGEVRDCSDLAIAGATVTSDQLDGQTKVTYFNGDTANPQPLVTQTATNTDGLYVVLNATTDPGKDVHTVSAAILDPTCAGTDSCQCVSMSSRTVRVFPDSVSIVTLRGDLPTLQAQ